MPLSADVRTQKLTVINVQTMNWSTLWNFAGELGGVRARADKGMDIGIGETGCAAVTRTWWAATCTLS